MGIGFIGNGKLTEQIQNFIPNPNTIFDDNTGDHSFNEYKKYLNKYKWILGIGYYHMKLRVAITDFILNNGGQFHTITHPSSYISQDSIIKEGAIIYPMCNIDTKVIIGHSTLLNNSVTICHDSYIDDGCYISPGVVICGQVTVSKGCFIGAGSIISNGVHIGENSVIGAGTIVTKDILANENVIGNPMKVLNKSLKLI